MQALSPSASPRALALLLSLSLVGACDKQPDDETTVDPSTTQSSSGSSGASSSTGGASSSTGGASSSTSTSTTDASSGGTVTSSPTTSTTAPTTDPSASDSGEKLDLPSGQTDGTSGSGGETDPPLKFDLPAP
ncbi:MAG: hypothetical protein H6713_35940 [Myxococcales bacterium]|nr:hypothetical protein [Myxococcales bacterium]